ncbi:MAG TPA: ferrochelatase [Longimicrobiales bacterium]|nr:ferrochelatase [Longimicrobiales bacterium]
MKTAVLLLNFGEPEHAVLEEVVPFLERIFGLNSDLEGQAGEAARARARSLAQARAPGLIEEYELIGGSPLHGQARAHRDRLQQELTRRGHDVIAINGMQFTPPFIVDAVREARAAGAERIVALPIYPLCGPSTTVAALRRLDADLGQQLWSVPLHRITGWHRQPAYIALRARAIQDVMRAHDLSFDERTRLVFSAHGTPMKYLDEGSRYQVYVRDFCAAVAAAAGAPDHVIGYQNHTNRPIEWTQPDIGTVIEEIDADRVIVDAASFMHEQSETLAELDHELKSAAQRRDLGFFRVPIPHDAPEFIAIMADLVEPFLRHDTAAAPPPAHSPGERPWQDCLCYAGGYCLNGARLEQHPAS